VLNAIVWCAKVDVPADGVKDKPLTLADLLANHDEPVPPDFKPEEIRKKFKLPAD
jgi:hypothetical protein